MRRVRGWPATKNTSSTSARYCAGGRSLRCAVKPSCVQRIVVLISVVKEYEPLYSHSCCCVSLTDGGSFNTAATCSASNRQPCSVFSQVSFTRKRLRRICP